MHDSSQPRGIAELGGESAQLGYTVGTRMPLPTGIPGLRNEGTVDFRQLTIYGISYPGKGIVATSESMPQPFPCTNEAPSRQCFAAIHALLCSG